jgi:hypothetical protein
MYQQQDVDWFNLPLYYYKDEIYDSDGVMRASASIGLSGSTFKHPKLSLQIQNGPLMKAIQFGYNDLYLLLMSIKTVESGTPFSDSSNDTVFLKMGKHQFILKYLTTTQAKIPECVKIQVFYSESDFSMVILSKYEYRAFLNFLSNFKDNFFTIISSLMSTAYMARMSGNLDEISRIQKGILNQIQLGLPETVSAAPELQENAKKTEQTIADLDHYMEQNAEKIKIPEVDEPKEKPVEEVESAFMKHFLKNDLMNIETKIGVISGSSHPIIDLANSFRIDMSGNDSSVNYLPSLTEPDLKSLLYLSKLLCGVMEKEYYDNGTPTPSSLPTLTYIPIDDAVQDYNLELAYDLLLTQGYLKLVKRRIESRGGIDDKNKKDILYMRLKLYTDAFVHGVLKTRKNQLESIMNKRFSYYKSIGLFNRYDQLLKDVGCEPIGEGDFSYFVTQHLKICERIPEVRVVHETLAKNSGLVVEYNNEYSMEQIINEIVPLETVHRLGKDLNKSEVLDPLIEQHKISPEIVALFLKKFTEQKVDEIPKTTSKKVKTWVHKFVGSKKETINEKIRDEFVKHIKDMGDKDYDWDKFSTDKIDLEIMKALHVWNTERKNLKNFQDYCLRIKECVHDSKESILNVTQIDEKKEDSGILDYLTDEE